MVRVVLDGHGHLRQFSGVPYASAQDSPVPVQPDAVFRAFGLDMAGFSEATPSFVPPSASDQVRAWTGKHPTIPNTNLNIEYASWKGRLTHARVIYPWEASSQQKSAAPTYWQNFLVGVTGWAILMMVLLARRNWKMGRMDRKGALRVAIVRFVLAAIAWVGTVHFLPSGAMIDNTFAAVGDWLFSGALMWLLYLALEPALRARWPHSIVTWNRLLAGKWLDAQVGAHVLIGATVGLALWIAADVAENLVSGSKNGLDSGGSWSFTLGTREWIGGHAQQFTGAFVSGLVIFFCLFGMKMLFRKDIIAAVVAALLFTFSNGSIFGASHFALTVGIYVAIYATLLFLLLRLGLVATIATVYFLNTSNTIMLGANWTTWYAPSAIATVLFMLGIAVFAFWRSLGNRELLGAD
jgi:serine/threonine-protein kinase